MKQRQGPYPGAGFLQMMAANGVFQMQALKSGELTGNITDAPLGSVNDGGKVSDVWVSVECSGKDDTNTLSLTVDVKINGTSCLSTTPIIAHVSGEASTNKTTKNDTDTGITVRVLDTDNYDVSPGDMLTYDMTLTRTASPTTEMRNMAVVVEFEPVS